MRQNTRNNGSEVSRILGRLAAQKKKAAIAFCLIAVMAFMWVRVFTRKGPQAAGAAVVAKQADPAGQINPQVKVSFIDLPEVAGRNDVITRDFFGVGSWQEFVAGRAGNRLANIKEVNIAPGDEGEEVARKVAEKLKLEGIVLGGNPQSFINGRLLSQGDKLPVTDGAVIYDCEVVGIEKNAVFVKCGKAQITLKLVQAVEVSN